MYRVPDWRNRLDVVLARYDGAPFVWGSTDCAHFAADCVEAVTGQDFLRTYRGTYACKLTAAGRIRGRGFRDLFDMAAHELEAIGAVPIHPRASRVGDIGVTSCRAYCVRLVGGFVARSSDGQFTSVDAVRAWRVGV